MTRVDTSSSRANAISASWARCQQKHQLERDTTRPILRLQLSEISPRWELLLHRTSGGQGIFQHLAKSAAHADNCLVITDENGVLVQLECKHKRRGAADWNGIGLGSLWDERIAGTNGVAMALLEKQPFTVRGEEHYLSKLMHFSCTATPLLDAENQTIGALNLTSIDRGNSADYLLAKHLLEVAADRLQRSLFEQKYVDSQIFSVSLPNHKALFKNNEMIAINEKGLIIGSTTKAYGLFDLNSPHELVGKSFELLFGADPESLHRVDKLTHSDTTNNLAHSIREHIPGQKFYRLNGGKQGSASSQCTHVNKSHFKRRSILELHELISSSSAVASLCKRSNQYFHHALPFIVEGASGTGKSSLINAIHESVKLHPNKILSIDCASLGDNDGDQTFIRNFVESTCTADSQKSFGKISSIVFDNIDEL
ncbi:MAG: sigma 54-interacting transcriptional regulator, partial [Granulosicoccus sp.]|nr:sigma 54-interacting transcriptional regulator [Granulosicoccus sp.]